MIDMIRLPVISGMKALIVFSVILLALIVGVYKAFTIPTEIEEQVTVLNYEHTGEFDYIAYLNASYLFGDIPLEATEPSPISSPTAPKYPIEIIDWIDMSFTYRLVPDGTVREISEQVEVKAVLNKPGVGAEEVILVPTTTQTGDFTVNFSLDLNDITSSSATTIEANVYTTVKTDKGPVFERFTQKLTIWTREPLLEMDKELGTTERASFGELSYEQIGSFDYAVRLKADSPFGAITLRPPSTTPPESPVLPSSKTVGPGETLFLTLFDKMDITFSYHFESDWPASQIAEEVEINAVLGNPDFWSKTFVLVPPTEKNGDFTVTFPLDNDRLDHFMDVFKAIVTETRASGERRLTIIADVHTIAQTPFGTIDEEFSHSLSTTLEGDTLEWEGKLVDSKAGDIKKSMMFPNPDKFIGLSVSQVRNLSASIMGIVFILFLYSLVMNVWFKPEKLPRIEEEALRARKKHKGVIVDVQELPGAEAAEIVIQLGSLDELIKAADNLLKPVLHKAEARKHTYCVIDGSTRYEYISEAYFH